MSYLKRTWSYVNGLNVNNDINNGSYDDECSGILRGVYHIMMSLKQSILHKKTSRAPPRISRHQTNIFSTRVVYCYISINASYDCNVSGI